MEMRALGRMMTTENKTRTEQILDIGFQEYGGPQPRLEELLGDVIDLYDGGWPQYESCQVGYHNLGHALEVTLAACRMVSGWNKLGQRPELTEDVFRQGVAACLFHDAGYIKDRGDNAGNGGKFTFNHVERSAAMARDYLAGKSWSQQDVEVVADIIACTDFPKPPDFTGRFTEKKQEIMAKITASADIIAQMSDINYLANIEALYEEFVEGYTVTSPEKLEQKGIKVFHSSQEILAGTKDFYENVVRSRLDILGRMGRFLTGYFGEGRNPYLENILANINTQAEKAQNRKGQWRRLGEILGELGVVSIHQIHEALDRQKKAKVEQEPLLSPFRRQVLAWLNKKRPGQCLGEILLANKDIDSKTLCQALLLQAFPPQLFRRMRRGDLMHLVRIMVLLSSIHKGDWVFCQVMELLNELIGCESSSVLLADPEAMEMIIVFPSGPKKRCIHGQAVPLDKGLAGWVYMHRKPIIVNNVESDERFYDEADRMTGYMTRSVLSVPLFALDECVGVLEAVNSKECGFTNHQMMVLGFLANVIASSLMTTIQIDGKLVVQS